MASKKNLLPTRHSFSIHSPSDLSKLWYVSFYEGKKRVRKYGKINQASTFDARMALAVALLDEIQGELPKETMYDRALEYLDAQTWRKKSLQSIKSIVDAFFKHAGPNPGARQVENFFLRIRQTKSPTTYNNYRQRLAQVLTGVGEGELIADVKAVRASSTPCLFFQRHQIAKLSGLIKAEDPELWLFVQFIYYCFIRPRELRQLKVGSVLLDDRRIYVPGAISKNKESQYVAIPDAFLPELAFLEDMNPGDYIFPWRRDHSKPAPENHYYNRHKKFLQRLKFGSGYTLYSWKHTGAVAAVKAGVGVKELQIQLRHHSLDQVNDYLRQMGVFDIPNLRESFPRI